jgi:hypothetical protein
MINASHLGLSDASSRSDADNTSLAEVSQKALIASYQVAMILICPRAGEVNFDHLLMVGSARCLIRKVTLFPFVRNVCGDRLRLGLFTYLFISISTYGFIFSLIHCSLWLWLFCPNCISGSPPAGFWVLFTFPYFWHNMTFCLIQHFSVLVWTQFILQGVLAPFSGEWYSETKSGARCAHWNRSGSQALFVDRVKK